MDRAREARIDRVTLAIRARTSNLRFHGEPQPDGELRLVEADYRAWATLTVRDGWTVTWACEWIDSGYPKPPDWLWRWSGARGVS